MTRHDAENQGRAFGLRAGEILAEETLKAAGPLPPEVVAERTRITRETIRTASMRFTTGTGRKHFRRAAERAVVDAMNGAIVTASASGQPN